MCASGASHGPGTEVIVGILSRRMVGDSEEAGTSSHRATSRKVWTE